MTIQGETMQPQIQKLDNIGALIEGEFAARTSDEKLQGLLNQYHDLCRATFHEARRTHDLEAMQGLIRVAERHSVGGIGVGKVQ